MHYSSMAQGKAAQFVTRQQMQPCKFYGSAKGCRMGDNCYYSHDDPTSVTLCNYYQGNCRNGSNCNFRHNIPNTSELCIYFNSPYGCLRKEKCKFKHIKSKQAEQDSTIRLYSMDELTEMKLNVPQREWRNISPIKKTECMLTISQFNCLAQSLCGAINGTDHLTFKCDPKYLIWEYRCKRILYEILQYKPDIICLQEIDFIHFTSFYYPNLSSMKYDGIFLKKNNIFNTFQSHISINDGIAIFWNTDKMDYTKKKFECILGEKSKCAQVALGIRLQLKQSKNIIFDVWNTHLKAGRSNENEDKRVKQCKILINKMKQYSNNIPIIFCGDFNLHFQQIINNKGIAVNNNAYKLLINHFKSLWNDKKINTFSCYQGWKDRDVVACFDYIMIGNNNGNKNDFFVLKQVLNGWQRNKIEKYQCKLPNKDYPSDHFLIATKIAVQIGKENNNKKRVFSLIDDDNDDGDDHNPSPTKKQRIQ